MFRLSPFSVRRPIGFAADLFTFCFLFLAISSGVSVAETKLEIGDQIEIDVYGVAELTRETVVDFDGYVSMPPLGRIESRGKSLEELEEEIQAQLVEKRLLNGAAITVTILARRPVLVSGDVANPGAFDFLFSMTARDAVALSGGIGISRLESNVQLAQLLGEKKVLLEELRSERARALRIAAEISGSSELDAAGTLSDPLAGLDGDTLLLSEYLARGARNLVANIREAEREKAFLLRTIDLTKSRLSALREQQKFQVQIMEEQAEEIERMRSIADRGLSIQSRVSEERRAFNAMQERASDTATEITFAQGELNASEHTLNRFDDRRRNRLETEALEVSAALRTGAAELIALTERIAQLGMSREADVRLKLHRTSEGKTTAKLIDFDEVLRPGDHLEVAISVQASWPVSEADSTSWRTE